METFGYVSTKFDKPTKQQTKEINKQSKQAFKQAWIDYENSEEDLVGQDIPNNFKEFTIQDKRFVS